MKKFNDLGRKIGGVPCVSLRAGGEYEDCISGERGEIWFVGGTLYRAVIVAGRKNEKLFTFDIKDLKRYILKIKKTSMSRSIYLANNPNERLKWGSK